jgi:hypothetical protein
MKPQASNLKSQASFVPSVLLVLFLISSCSNAPILPKVPPPALENQNLENAQGDQYSDVLSRRAFQFWHDAGWLPVPNASESTPTIPLRTATSSALVQPSAAPVLRSAQITWDPSLEPDLKRYLVKRSDNAPTAEIVIADITTTPTLSFTVENPGFDAPVIKNGKVCGLTDAKLDPAHTYYYSVFAVDVSGNVSLPALLDPSGARLRVRFTPLNPPTGVKVFVIYP